MKRLCRWFHKYTNITPDYDRRAVEFRLKQLDLWLDIMEREKAEEEQRRRNRNYMQKRFPNQQEP